VGSESDGDEDEERGEGLEDEEGGIHGEGALYAVR
jgi:hypothetical protein